MNTQAETIYKLIDENNRKMMSMTQSIPVTDKKWQSAKNDPKSAASLFTKLELYKYEAKLCAEISIHLWDAFTYAENGFVDGMNQELEKVAEISEFSQVAATNRQERLAMWREQNRVAKQERKVLRKESLGQPVPVEFK